MGLPRPIPSVAYPYGYAELATVTLSQRDEAGCHCHTGRDIQFHHGKDKIWQDQKRKKN